MNWTTTTPNPSLEWTATGKPAWPRGSCCLSSASRPSRLTGVRPSAQTLGLAMKTEPTHPLVEQLEPLLLPTLRENATTLAAAVPGLRCVVHAEPVGSKTPYQGFQFTLSCLLPNLPAAAADEVALVVDLCHLDREPRLTAEVVWGHGQVEASFRPECGSSQEWPHVTPELVAELQARFPALLASLRHAALRGGPSEA